MKLSQKIMSVLLAALMVLPMLPIVTMEANAAKSFANSDFIETEQPELSEETKKLISLYQKNPTEENYLNLRDMVIENYNRRARSPPLRVEICFCWSAGVKRKCWRNCIGE